MMCSNNILEEYPWITIELLEDALKGKLLSDQSISVQTFDIELALKPGENYGSQILRAYIKYVCSGDGKNGEGSPQDDESSAVKTVPVVIKASLGTRLVRSCNVFEKEIFMFNDIIPKVEQLLRAVGIHTKMAPMCIRSSVDLSYLVFEDLNLNGFRNVKRTLGLDFDHLKIILTKLSRWHAATGILIQQNPELTRLYPKPHVHLNGSPRYRDLFENAVSTCGEVFKNAAGYETIANKLFRLEEKVFERCCNACSRDDTQFNVLAHGDLWGNNIMFSYNEFGQPCDALLIDFQVGYWGSPVLDLTYLLFTSSHADVKDLEWEQLIQHYYDELKATLIQLNYQYHIPTYHEFQTQIASKGVYSAIFSIFSVTMRLLEEVKDDSMVLRFFGRSEEEKKFRMELMQRPKTRSLLENLLKYFDKKRFLD